MIEEFLVPAIVLVLGLGVTGTYDLNNLKSSGLLNSWSFGSIGGGVWKTGTVVIPMTKKD